MHRNTRRRTAWIAAAALVVTAIPGLAEARRDDGELATPKPSDGARQQIGELRGDGQHELAALVGEMIDTPQAQWFTQGTPHSTRQSVKAAVKHARAKGTVPVLVAYNIPFRDCAQFSAGGATSVAEYEAWIDGFAAGIGDAEAIVILEPDGLGIIPHYTTVEGQLEWCQPAEASPETAADERFAMLRYAVERLDGLAAVDVYLDGTHSGWLNVGDITTRLIDAGVHDADGFFLNASNYQYTENLVHYGTWISSCIALVEGGAAATGCANQYWNGGPDGTAIADLLGPWTGVALDGQGIWSDDATDPTLNTSGVAARYAGADATTRFVIDTSRNGQGPWAAPAYPDPQDWCNPPGRGLGLTPDTDTGIELVAAYLWIKIPGESDGECTRGLGDAGSTVDPEWGLVDPAAGDWFPAMTIDLVTNARPALTP